MREVSSRKGWGYQATFTDPGISGATKPEDRPGMRACFESADRREFDRLLTFDASRLARDQGVFWSIIGSLKERGISYCTAIMPDIDSESPEFQIVAGALQGAAAYERRLTAKKVKIGMDVLRNKGHHMGRPKAGCRINDEGKLELDPQGERVRSLLERLPNLRASELQIELSTKDYDTAYHLLKAVKAFLASDVR